MLFVADIRPYLQALLHSGRVRYTLLSMVFGLLVIGIYYLLRLVIPSGISFHEELTTIAFIIISVLLLFPAREWILSRFLSRYDYLAFFGHDLHHLELLARHFSVEDLKGKIFCEFCDWLGVPHATLAILDPGRNFYRYYTYRLGKGIQEDRNFPNMEALIKYMKLHRRRVEILDEKLTPEVRERMESLGIYLVDPFIFRKGLPGFLILYSPPRHTFADRALHYFADKSAVAIQNYLLSSRIIDSQLYDDELESARRIQRLLHETRIPRIECFEIEHRGSSRAVIEFFKKSQDSYYFVALASTRLQSASGIILYGLLGSLHAILEREPGIQINELLKK